MQVENLVPGTSREKLHYIRQSRAYSQVQELIWNTFYSRLLSNPSESGHLCTAKDDRRRGGTERCGLGKTVVRFAMVLVDVDAFDGKDLGAEHWNSFRKCA